MTVCIILKCNDMLLKQAKFGNSLFHRICFLALGKEMYRVSYVIAVYGHKSLS